MVVVVFSGRWTTCAALCLVLFVSGCSDDDDPASEEPPESPSSSSSSTDATAPPTDEPTTVPPATGPVLEVKDIAVRMPEGWAVDNDDASFLVVGADAEKDTLINLSSFPALDPDVSIRRLARITEESGGYAKGSVLPPTTMAGQPAFHVAGDVVGDFHEDFGLIHEAGSCRSSSSICGGRGPAGRS